MMSQHSQLAAGSGIVPDDGQFGDVLTGPVLATAARSGCSDRVAVVGVEPGSFIRRAVLWQAFGPAEVEALDFGGFIDQKTDARAVVIHHVTTPPSWEQLLDWAGARRVIVDIQAAVAMAAESGFSPRVRTSSGTTAVKLDVMCHQENRLVYPQAPAVEMVEEPPVAAGMAVGDRVHMYAPSAADLILRVLNSDPQLNLFIERYRAVAWGRDRVTGGVALLTCPTAAGGQVTIMDLNTIERSPEPCGSETPAIQIFLSLLGRSPVSFGRFVTPPAHYCEFLDSLERIRQRYPRFSALETIGRSVEGKEIKLMKIGRRFDLPVVLLTCAVHPYEWAPIFGVMRYLQYLLQQLESEGFAAEELLRQHQVWWVPSVCPDGFENRCQQPSAINLNRNFPDGWEYAAEGQLCWGNFGAPHTINQIEPISLRGPGPGSQPEVQALMELLERRDARVVTLADFHENVGTGNFLHQFEDSDANIPHGAYQVELLEGINQAFSGRFFEQRGNSFYRVEHSRNFAPSGLTCAWLGYAVKKGAKGCVVEASGGDITHYRTVRRTEYAAQVTEQVLGAELGRIYRNPWGHDEEIRMRLRRRPESVLCRLYDAAGARIEESTAANPDLITRTVPAGGCLRLRYDL